MRTNLMRFILTLAIMLGGVFAQDKPNANILQMMDVFELEYGSDPQISPDGKKVVYVRNFMDVMTDRKRTNLWIINASGSDHRPLTSGKNSYGSPRWSPDGNRLAYSASLDGSSQLYVRWMDTGQTAKITNLTSSPGGLSWSPDGKWIAFTMHVLEKSPKLATMPSPPKGAEWAPPARVMEKLQYRTNNAGYLKDGYRHIFVVPSEGGTPRQITSGAFNHGSTPVWTSNGKSLIISANRHDEWEYDPNDSEIYEVSVTDGTVKALTTRHGRDSNPVLSPNGKQVAYLGYDEKYKGFQVVHLYTMNRDGSRSKLITGSFDRSLNTPRWAADGKGLYFQYVNEGNTKIGYTSLSGKVKEVVGDVGGTSLGRPYSSGSYSISKGDAIAYTTTRPEYPADIAVLRKGGSKGQIVTRLNADLLATKELGKVEEIWYNSSFDNRKVHGWIVKPPGFDPKKKYPLILEIHGGPFANYGDRFSTEVQLYAAAGYVVLYTNPRGSTSYGTEFGNLIDHNYPSEDYDDLMSGVDAVIAKGYIDADNLFVTGGSGGGVLSAWIVGKTTRFKAAVVAKPVINWASLTLTTDLAVFMNKYWFSGYPWEIPEEYFKYSPLSLVGNVKTPTMLLTGEVDYRTPISESEQYYQALKLLKVPSALVRIPESSHGITARPSNLIKKVSHILAWFERYRTDK